MVQYGQIADYVVSKRRPRVQVNDLASLLRGQQPFFTDEIHPGERYATLAADVTLWECGRTSLYRSRCRLREAVEAGRSIR